MSQYPNESNQQYAERRERNLSQMLMYAGRGAPHDFRPILRLFGDWRDRIGFGRYATVFIQNDMPETLEKGYSCKLAGRGEAPAYNVQREAGINFPVSWPVTQNGSVVFEHCSTWSVLRSNDNMRESKKLRFHVEYYVEPGNQTVEFGWAQEDPARLVNYSVMLDRPSKTAPGLWFCVTVLKG